MCDLIVNKSAYNKSLITFWTDLVCYKEHRVCDLKVSNNTDNCSLCNCEDYNCLEKSDQCSMTGIKKRGDPLKLST